MNYTEVTLQSAGSILLLVIAYKLYTLRIHTLSHCCKDSVVVETNNEGGNELDIEIGV